MVPRSAGLTMKDMGSDDNTIMRRLNIMTSRIKPHTASTMKRRVLLISDNPPASLTSGLRQLGVRTTTKSWRDPSRVIAASRPDIVIMDVDSSKRKRPAALAARNAICPVIFFLRGRLRPFGKGAYVREPLSRTSLEESVWSALESKSAPAPPDGSRALYESLFNGTHEGIIAVDEEQRVVLFNHGAEQKFGYTSDEILGKPLSLLVPEVFRNRHETKVRTFQKTAKIGKETGKRAPLPCRRKDGSEFVADIALSVYLDRGRRFYMALVHDVTDHHQLLADLHRNQEKYRIVADNTYDWEFWLTPDRRYVYSSPSCERITGYPADAFLRDAGLLERIIHEDDAQKFRDHQASVCGSPAVVDNLEFRIVRRDGEVRWIGHVCQPIFGANNEWLGIRGSNRDITERKQMEEQLRISESSYQGILNSITEAVYVQDENGRFLDVNQAAVRMYGYPREYFIGRTPEFLSAPDKNDFEAVADHVQKALQGVPQRFQFWGLRKDGSVFPKHVSLTPGTYFGKKVVIAVARDVTEWWRMETRYKALIENAPDGVVLISRDGKFLYGSPSVVRIFDYRPGDMATLNPADLTHPEDLGRVQSALAQLIENPATMPVLSYRFKHKDGSWRWIESTFSNLLSESSVGAIVINFRDITERRLAEEALMASEEKYRLLAETSRDLVVLDDIDGHILYANPSVERLLGYPLAELRQRTVFDIVAPEFIPATLERRARRAEGHLAMQQYEIDLLTRDGLRIPFEVSTTVATGGDRPLVVSVARDIRERRKAEESLKNQLRFSRALNRMMETAMVSDTSRDEMLDSMVQVIGGALDVDRCLIFDIHIAAGHVRSLSKWMGNGIDDFAPGIETYDLALFPQSAVRLAHEGQPIVSHDNERHPILVAEGSAPLLHDRMKVRSLLWFPFDRRVDGCFLLVFNQMNRQRNWTPEELDFVDSVSKHVTIALMKMRLVAERHEAEQYQRAAEQRYREIFDNVVEGVFQTSLHGDFIVANSAMARILGYDSPEDLMHQVTHIEKQLYADPNRRRELQALLDERDHVVDFESRVFRRDGQMIWISENIRVVRNPSGKPAYYEGTIVDITDRKTIEIKLVETLREFETLIEGIPDGVFLKDAHGRWLVTNAPAKKLFRLDGVEWYGKTDQELAILQPEMAYAYDQCIRLDETAWKNGCKTVGLEIIADTSGVRHYLEVTKTPLFDEAGGRLGLVIVGHDVTLERETRETIKEQEFLLDNAKDAIVVTDLDDRVLYWNHSAEKLYEWKREEAVNQNLTKLLSAHDVPDTLADILRSGGWAGELVHRSRSGRELLVESRQSLIKDSSGQPKSVLFINSDITEKKKMEQQFLRAQRAESIGRMASGIAHDLNNILSPILMAVQMFKERVPDPNLQKFIPLLESNVQRGADLMKKLLMFTRGVEGQYVRVDLGRVLSEVDHIVRSTFPKNIAVQTVAPSNLWPIRGDVTQLHQILLNLCVNARDAMPEGGHLSIEAENIVFQSGYVHRDQEAQPGPYVSVRVTDTGTGIPQDIQERMFEPFFSTKGIESGTGLGLSTVAALVKAHQGVVAVHSEVGQGTTFKVFIPASGVTSDKTEGNAGGSIWRGHGEIVLVVDDEPPIRKILTSILEAQGYKVMVAGDGHEALTIFREHAARIRVVVTDMSMPKLDGAALVKQLKAMSADVRIVAMSGLPHGVGDEKSGRLPVDAFLMKPYQAEEMLEVLHKLLLPQGAKA